MTATHAGPRGHTLKVAAQKDAGEKAENGDDPRANAHIAKRPKTRMAVSGGKMMRLEMSMVPIMRMPMTMVTAVSRAMSVLSAPTRVPVARAKGSSKVMANTRW